MPKIESSSLEDLQFDGEAMDSMFEETDCWLVALDDWEIALILSSLRYAHWQKRWRNLGDYTWDEIEAAICNLEHCLMAGCNVQNLIKTNLMMIAAMTGQTINLDNVNDNFFTGSKDYTTKGLANRLGPEALHSANTSISARIKEAGECLCNLTDQFIGPDGETFASMFNIIEEELAGEAVILGTIEASLAITAGNTTAINSTLNETLNLEDHGGLDNNINDRLRKLNITVGGLIDGVDLLSIADNLKELNKIRESLQSLVFRGDGDSELLSMSDLFVKLVKTLDGIRDNLDLVIQDSDDESPKEYSVTAIIHQMMYELTDRVDKIRDNLDVFVPSEGKEFGLASLLNGMALYAFEMQNSLHCVADALNSECSSPFAPTHYSQEGQSQEEDYGTELIHDWEMINDPDEGDVEGLDEFIQTLDFSSPPGNITYARTLLVKQTEQIGGTEGRNYILSIDIVASGFVEIWIHTDDLAVPWQDTVRTELQQNFINEEWEWVAMVEIYNNALYDIPDNGTFYLTDAATGVTTTKTWEPQQ